MELESSPLVSLALDGIARLEGDEAKEEALHTLGSVIAGQALGDEAAERAFERLLRASASLEAPWVRSRAFAEACASLGCSRLPRERRAALLELAIDLASTAPEPLERIERVRAALQGLAEVRRDDAVVARLAALATEAASLDDARARLRTVSQIALALAKSGEGARAVALVDQLAPSAGRARIMAQLAVERAAASEVDEAAALIEAALGEVRAEPESHDKALALREVLVALFETAIELPSGDGVAMALDAVDKLDDGRFKKDALLGAIEALDGARLENDRFADALERLRQSIERVGETFTRAPLLGALGLALARRGDARGAERALATVASMVVGAAPAELVDTLGDPLAALPVALILGALSHEEDARLVHDFAMHALEIVRPIDEPATVASILRQAAQFFASPALPYEVRLALLDRALWVAEAISAPEQCVEAVTAIANALSLAGATERGDGLFAGLVIGLDPRLARKAHLERAITLVRLGRTADARDRLLAASAILGGDSWHALEELAQACARCGFIGDVIGVLSHVDPTRQLEARTQVADVLAESSYLDPALRIIGLESLAADAEPAVADTVAVLISEVRLLEKMGEPADALARGFERAEGMERHAAGAALAQELVGALIERVRRDGL